jgi:hypothetical protein
MGAEPEQGTDADGRGEKPALAEFVAVLLDYARNAESANRDEDVLALANAYFPLWRRARGGQYEPQVYSALSTLSFAIDEATDDPGDPHVPGAQSRLPVLVHQVLAVIENSSRA